MSDTTKIEWATSTGNPWIGCTKVSPGCKNCYAATLDEKRFSKTMGGGTKANPVSHWGPGAPRFRTKGFWKDAVKWNNSVQAEINERCRSLSDTNDDPIQRPRIFPSLCDWLDEEVPIEWLADFLKLIHDTPNLDWLLLTKRPENWFSLIAKARNHLTLKDADAALWVHNWLPKPATNGGWIGKQAISAHPAVPGQPPHNVWIGTSVENQENDGRIYHLLKIPAKVRFLSVEPLLGPISLTSEVPMPANEDHPACVGYMVGKDDGQTSLSVTRAEALKHSGIHWVIVGGESGKGARPCNVEWIRDIVKQCKAASVPCFVKQLGSVPIEVTYSGNMAIKPEAKRPFQNRLYLKHPKGGDPAEWPQDLRVREFPV